MGVGEEAGGAVSVASEADDGANWASPPVGKTTDPCAVSISWTSNAVAPNFTPRLSSVPMRPTLQHPAAPRPAIVRRCARLAGVLAFLHFAGSAPADPLVSVDRIVADGVPLPLPADSAGPVRLRAHTRMLDFHFAPKSPPGTPPFRYRFQLEGRDPGWCDSIGAMRFTVRFNDAKGNAVSGEEFDAHGESRGWTGDPVTSRFIARRETLEVPAGAARLQIWLNSAGPQETMGVYALDALTVTLIPRDPAGQPETVEMIPREGSLMETSLGTPAGWARHGTSLSIAQIAARAGQAPLIVMRDDRPDSFGGWQTERERSAPLDGIGRVQLDWKEAYSIGWGGTVRQSYAYLPAGEYRLRLQTCTRRGQTLRQCDGHAHHGGAAVL